ncbi:hypothetical protein [Polaromonas sp.]|uniref:hypothetical protein n=1 Tax=Polaromonas sp. TaxID=1869339 RepID=UPI003C85E221
MKNARSAGILDKALKVLLLGSGFFFLGFLGCSSFFSFGGFGSGGFFFLGLLGCSSFFGLGGFGSGGFFSLGFLGIGFCVSFGSRSGRHCRRSSYCGSSRSSWGSRSGSLCKSTGSEKTSDQGSDDFVHEDFL